MMQNRMRPSQIYRPQPVSFIDHQNFSPIILCAQQRQKSQYLFPRKDEDEIRRIVMSKSNAPLEILLKFVHHKFYDEGLRYTLIHKMFDCSNEEIEFYVPELVYLAIKKNCKPIKKFLVQKAERNQALLRLIYWNVKAFTVLIKQKDLQIKRIIEQFQQDLISKVVKNRFNHSEKAIATITTASLALKKMQGVNLKQKLQHFIKRFNAQYLSTTDHSIMIPFRKDEDTSAFNSTLVVRIVQEDCSCFPTRKRVPYRIIIETIDPSQLALSKPSDEFNIKKKVEADKDRDLFDEVNQSLESIFGQTKFKSLLANSDTQYPYVIDKEENLKINQLQKFAKKIQIQEKQLQKEKNDNLVINKLKSSFILRKNTTLSKQSGDFNKSFARIKDRYQILNNPNLQLFEATYIPTLPSNMRKSACHIQSTDDLFNLQKTQKLRWSSGADSSIKKSQDNIKVIEQETRWNQTYDQSAWGLPWVAKEKKYKQTSYFKNFQSLRLHNVVVKGGDDLRQEIICMQLIYKMRDIIKKAGIDVFIKPYEIIVLSENSGILQFVSNSISVDSMKKQRQGLSISEFFSQVFQTQPKLLKAKENFIRSLVGSSILTYVLKLKDRHNGNILLDNQGHIIHIDFGFILGMSPGGINFESSPFKLTEEYVEFMGGKDSTDYQFFQELFCQGMRVLRDRMDELCLVLEIMMQDSDLECFKDFKIQVFKERLKPSFSSQKFHDHCMSLIEKSCMNSRTVQYDYFQYYQNGILA